jgi:hypothetical protein
MTQEKEGWNGISNSSPGRTIYRVGVKEMEAGESGESTDR